MHFSTSTNGTNASQTIDSSPSAHAISGSYGQSHLDTQYSKFGGSSARFDGTGDYLSLADSDDWAFGTGDFTIDFWVRFNDVTTTKTHGFAGQYADVSNYWWIWADVASGTAQIQMRFNSGGITQLNLWTDPVVTIVADTWYHIVFERTTTTAKIFVNGISQPLTVDTAFGTNDVGNIAAVLTVGKTEAPPAVISYMGGYIDELRISKGLARWTSGFSVPTSEYGTAKFGDIQYYGEDRTTRFKVGSFTRDTSIASGTQSVTGVGFKPKAVTFFMDVRASSTRISWGFDDGTNSHVMRTDEGTTNYYDNSGFSIFDSSGAGLEYKGSISSFNSDGFTITWTKTGSPSGTLNIGYLAFR